MNSKIFLLCFFVFSILFPLHAQKKNDSKIISIIPKPVTLIEGKGEFYFNAHTKILASENSEEMLSLGNLIADEINQSTGWNLSATTTHNASRNFVLLQIKKDFRHAEGYSLEINRNQIVITAGSGAGIFYAIQSLFQLLPVEFGKTNASVPCLKAEDHPRFKWRGVHLDVCRHFFPVEFMKKYIDILAMYKMNTLHLHLTDDQGWRIEIKKYPKLTQIGAWRKETMGDGKPYSGFYTQDQIKEIVTYAKERYITIVPEIEMPGHAVAALAAYPELSCTGGPFDVATTWGVFDDVYCAGNEKVFQFLEDVLTEVMDLFPSEYIHVGGDEVPKTRWQNCPKCQARIKNEGLKNESELQSYFVQRIEKFLNSKGRKIIGWDEILEGGLAQNAAVMSWRGIDGGIAAARAKHYAVMCPWTHCYFDHYQGLSGEPIAIGGYTPLEKVYSYEPIPDSLNADESKYIMGAQANVWTEYIGTADHVEYMLLPRLCALSEVVWSPKNLRDYKDFSDRIKKHYQILLRKNINFRVPPPISETGELVITKSKAVVLSSPIRNSAIHLTFDGTEPTTASPLYDKPLEISKSEFLKAKTFLENGKSSVTASLQISLIDSTVNGLNYKYYEGTWSALPNFDLLKPVREGKTHNISLSAIATRDENLGVVWSGFINISIGGDYTFYLSSDDGTKLFIDDNLLIDNDGAHSNNEISGKIKLTAGKHSIKILYFQIGGAKTLSFDYEGPNITRRMVPASDFYFAK